MLVSPPIYLWYFCVSMSLLPFDLKSWPLMKRTRDNVLGYLWQAWSWYMLQSLQNALFGYFIQECLSLFGDIIYLPCAIHMSLPSAEPWSLKFGILLNQCLKQPAIMRSRYLAVTTPRNSRKTHSSPVRARYGCFFMSSKCDRSFMFEVYAVCNTAIYRESIACFYG